VPVNYSINVMRVDISETYVSMCQSQYVNISTCQ
jgi:hypothetical protein